MLFLSMVHKRSQEFFCSNLGKPCTPAARLCTRDLLCWNSFGLLHSSERRSTTANSHFIQLCALKFLANVYGRLT